MREVSVGDDERNQGEAFNYPQLCSQNSKIARRILHDQNVSRVQCLIQVLQQIVLTTDKSGIGVRWLLSCEPIWCFMFNPGHVLLCNLFEQRCKATNISQYRENKV